MMTGAFVEGHGCGCCEIPVDYSSLSLHFHFRTTADYNYLVPRADSNSGRNSNNNTLFLCNFSD